MTSGKRKPGAAVHPFPEMLYEQASATSSLLSALLTQWCPCCSGTSRIPSTSICFAGPVYWFWVTGFLSLFFRVQIPFLPLSGCPRLLWQPLVFGKLTAVFQAVEFPFYSCTSLIPQIFHENFLMPHNCACLILIIFTITPSCCYQFGPILQNRKQRLHVANLSEVAYIVSGRAGI